MSFNFDATGKLEETWDVADWVGPDLGVVLVPSDTNAWWFWGDGGIGGKKSQITSAAKNPLSAGRAGFRRWIGDGNNRHTRSPIIYFWDSYGYTGPRFRELWVRAYIRYEAGFVWDYFNYDKMLRFGPHINHGPNTIMHMRYDNRIGVSVERSPDTGASDLHSNNHGWSTSFTNGTGYGSPSHGNFVCIEIHVKYESAVGQSNGIARFWVNGERIVNKTNMRYLDPNSTTYDPQEAWNKGIEQLWFCNQADPGNANGPLGRSPAYVDMDDICMYNKTPPNVDAHGTPFIGPVGIAQSFSVGSTANPTSGQAPLLVDFTASAQNGTTPYTYAWNFGDGNTSQDQNPSHIYNTAGSFEAVVTATDAELIQATSKSDITVYDPEVSTQYYTDFDDYELNVYPVPNWTQRDSTGVGWNVKVKDGMPMLCALPDTNPYGERRLLTWNEPGLTTDTEILMMYRIHEGTRQGQVYLRAEGNPNIHDAYQVRHHWDGTILYIRRILNGAPTVLTEVATALNAINTWYAIRFRAETLGNGNVRLRAKNWEPSDLTDVTLNEPDWLLDYEDSHVNRITSSGRMGVGLQRNLEDVDFAFVGVGVGGAVAPTYFVGVDPDPGLQPGNLVMTDEGWDSEPWYDGSPGPIVDGALYWHWTQGNTTPDGTTVARRYIGASLTEFLVEFEILLDPNWRGSGGNWHPHIFNLLSVDDGEWQGPALAHSCVYFEWLAETTPPYDTYMLFAHQDARRVNKNHGSLPNDLTSITENRSSNNCNTPWAWNGYTHGTCYAYTNDFHYSSSGATATTGAMPKGQWFRVWYYVKNNTFTSGVANKDGILRMWMNDTLTYESTATIFTAGAFAYSAWDKFLLAPYIEQGSPINQYCYVRNLKIYDGMGEDFDPGPLPPAGTELLGDWSNTIEWDDTTPVDSNFIKFHGDGHIKIGGNGHFKVLP